MKTHYYYFGQWLHCTTALQIQTAKNLSSDQNVEDEGLKSKGECITNRRQSVPLEFSFASFREISPGYVQYGGEGGDTKAY